VEAGVVVVVNGASSSGKTSLARALQLLAPDPWLHAGIDRFWGMMPQGWMQLGARADEGVSWLRGEDEYGRPVVHTLPGPVATRMARGMHRAVAALARGGSNVVSDDVFFDPAWASDWAVALDGLDAWLVALHCPEVELERRERGRGDREPGEARAEASAIHDGVPYDLELDSSSLPAEALAAAVLDHVATACPRALDRLRAGRGASEHNAG
jgi:chloramphenicol 3-O phosphotransferase